MCFTISTCTCTKCFAPRLNLRKSLNTHCSFNERTHTHTHTSPKPFMSCRHCQQKGKWSKTYPMNQKNEILTLSLFISLERGEIHAKKLKVRIASRVHSRNLSIMTWTAGPIVLQPWVNPLKKNSFSQPMQWSIRSKETRATWPSTLWTKTTSASL